MEIVSPQHFVSFSFPALEFGKNRQIYYPKDRADNAAVGMFAPDTERQHLEHGLSEKIVTGARNVIEEEREARPCSSAGHSR